MSFLCSIGVFLLVLFVGSALLRAGVMIANRIIGPVKKTEVIGWDWDSDEEDDDDLSPANTEPPIPEPGVGQGMLIMFVVILVNGIVGFVFTVILELDRPRDIEDNAARVAAILVGISLGFVLMTGMLASMLPTTPKRAALSAACMYGLLLAVALLIGFVMFVVRS